jgi:cytochrome d ubiquinol oxidase subunit I
VAPVFFAFRLMVGMWLVMMGMTVWAWILAARRRLFDTKLYLRAANWTIPAGYIAVTAGWITTEVGRQPWVVYGHLRTAESVTPSLTGGDVVVSLLAYIAVYLVIFGSGAYYLIRLVQRGLPGEAQDPRPDQRPARPLSAAAEAE